VRAGAADGLAGVVLNRDARIGTFPATFVEAVGKHRFWSRSGGSKPARG
jgi:hypothetical protein